MDERRSKRIIVHLGPPKTGTTTIQAFLYRARDALRQCGVRYADAGRIRSGQTLTVHRPAGIKRMSGPSTAQHLLPWTLLGEVDEVCADDVWNELAAEIAACAEKTVVVSSEAFSRLNREQVSEIRERLHPHTVVPVAYLRKPLSRVLSDYTQRVKSGRCDSTFGDFLERERHLLERYDGFIDHWDATFDRDALVIRSFDAAVAGNGLEQDFATLVTGRFDTLGGYREQGRLNKSPGVTTIRTQRAINRLQTLLGRPARIRRVFDAARKVVTLRGPVAVQRRLGSEAALETGDDIALIDALTAERYAELLARSRTNSAASVRNID